MGKNFLDEARKNKNDEFYTLYDDIDKELKHYKEYFKDKVVCCPCDNPLKSNFYKWFADNFETLGLKKLIVSCYVPYNGSFGLFDSFIDFNNMGGGDSLENNKHPRGFYYIYDGSNKKYPDRKDITYFKENGDFRSPEVKKFIKESDVIVTNPPFSLFRQFVNLIHKNKKKFILCGNYVAISFKNIFTMFEKNEIGFGFRSLETPMYFDINEELKDYFLANKNRGSSYEIINDKVYGRLATSCWFTNFKIKNTKKFLTLNTMAWNLENNKRLQNELKRKYGVLEYPRYDNYNAIEVPFINAIPSDFEGIMGVPITFLEKFNPEQFRIVKFRKGSDDDNKDLMINGKTIFFRILIQRKTE